VLINWITSSDGSGSAKISLEIFGLATDMYSGVNLDRQSKRGVREENHENDY